MPGKAWVVLLTQTLACCCSEIAERAVASREFCIVASNTNHWLVKLPFAASTNMMIFPKKGPAESIVTVCHPWVIAAWDFAGTKVKAIATATTNRIIKLFLFMMPSEWCWEKNFHDYCLIYSSKFPSRCLLIYSSAYSFMSLAMIGEEILSFLDTWPIYASA